MDLKDYSLDDLLLTAIKSEIESRDVYKKVSKNLKNALLKDRLRFLAEEEEKHRRFFEVIYRERFPGKRILLPEDTPVPLPKPRIADERLPISEVFFQAMTAEKAAYNFYLSLAVLFKDEPEMERMLFYIASMEMSHYKILEIEKENAEKFEDYEINWPMTHIGP